MISVTFPPLHPGQTVVRDSRARFKVLVAGRRWGKTRLAILLCLQTAFQGGRTWWVGPTFPVAEIAWRMLRALVRPIPGTAIREVDRRVMLKLRDSGFARAVLLVAATRANRLTLRAVGAGLAANYPVPSAVALRALAMGRDPGGNSIILL